jgi:hypothetical protein
MLLSQLRKEALIMKCAICGISIDLVKDSIDHKWVSVFYEGNEEHGPICSSCFDQFIRKGKDGEFELKDEYRGRIVYNEQTDDSPHYITIDLGPILN